MIKALIFDFDGLIMDTESPEVDGWKAIYAEYGQEFPLQVWLQEVVGSTIANFDPAAHLAARLGRELDLPALRARVRRHRLQKLSISPVLPGVMDYIVAARRLGLRLAVASSSEHAWVEKYLRQLGLLDEFELLICREDVRYIKPDPDLFLAALEALRLQAEDILILEDSRNGVLAARRAGLRVVAVLNPITALGTIEEASLVLSSLAEMPLEDLLKQIEPNNRQQRLKNENAHQSSIR